MKTVTWMLVGTIWFVVCLFFVAAGGPVLGVLMLIGGPAAYFQIKRNRSNNLKLAEEQRAFSLTGDKGVLLIYEGGHPEIPMPCDAALRPMPWGFELIANGRVVPIHRTAIVSLNRDANVQHVNTGGGRDLKGATAGYLLFGPVGAIVGGRGKTKVERFETSRILMSIRLANGIQVQLSFVGDAKAYARVSGLLARAA